MWRNLSYRKPSVYHTNKPQSLTAHTCDSRAVHHFLRQETRALLPNTWQDNKETAVKGLPCLSNQIGSGQVRLVALRPLQGESGQTQPSSPACVRLWEKWSQMPARHPVDWSVNKGPWPRKALVFEAGSGPGLITQAPTWLSAFPLSFCECSAHVPH